MQRRIVELAGRVSPLLRRQVPRVLAPTERGYWEDFYYEDMGRFFFLPGYVWSRSSLHAAINAQDGTIVPSPSQVVVFSRAFRGLLAGEKLHQVYSPVHGTRMEVYVVLNDGEWTDVGHVMVRVNPTGFKVWPNLLCVS
jgi:hypothetical protein